MSVSIITKNNIKKKGNVPLVVLPLQYHEKRKEDLDMLRSKKLPKDIKKARNEIKKGIMFSLSEAKKKLRLV